MLSEEQLENYRNHGRGDFGNLSNTKIFCLILCIC